MPENFHSAEGEAEEICTYRVQQYELHVVTYEVETTTVAHAIRRILDGDGHLVEPSPALAGVLQDRGMHVDPTGELAQALQKLHVPMTAGVVDSIKSAEKIESSNT